VARVQEWEAGFARFLKSERPTVLAEIEAKKALDDNLFERLKAAISTYNHQFGVEGYNDVADPGEKADAPAPAAAAVAAPTAPKADGAKPKAAPKKPRVK
jgi:hypothetical protein